MIQQSGRFRGEEARMMRYINAGGGVHQVKFSSTRLAVLEDRVRVRV